MKSALNLGVTQEVLSIDELMNHAQLLNLKLERYDENHVGGHTIMDYTSGYGYGDGNGIDIL